MRNRNSIIVFISKILMYYTFSNKSYYEYNIYYTYHKLKYYLLGVYVSFIRLTTASAFTPRNNLRKKELSNFNSFE